MYALHTSRYRLSYLWACDIPSHLAVPRSSVKSCDRYLTSSPQLPSLKNCTVIISRPVSAPVSDIVRQSEWQVKDRKTIMTTNNHHNPSENDSTAYPLASNIPLINAPGTWLPKPVCLSATIIPFTQLPIDRQTDDARLLDLPVSCLDRITRRPSSDAR